ncbi:hypothetical protein V1478_009845 [Vespula squamosa]|uniref:Uncharacterized protein n=1 Tax=Vespula squamosa TaxID=30214 RepID=A0ABD2AJL1_VESSQ
MHMHSNRAANARMHPPPLPPPPPPPPSPPPSPPQAGRRLAARLCEWESSGMQLKRHDRQRRIRFTRSSSTSIPTDLQSWRALVIRFTERLYVRQQHHQQQQQQQQQKKQKQCALNASARGNATLTQQRLQPRNESTWTC